MWDNLWSFRDCGTNPSGNFGTLSMYDTSARGSIWIVPSFAWTVVATRKVSADVITTSIVCFTLPYIWGDVIRVELVDHVVLSVCLIDYLHCRRYQYIQVSSHSFQCLYCTFRWHKVAGKSLEWCMFSTWIYILFTLRYLTLLVEALYRDARHNAFVVSVTNA